MKVFLIIFTILWFVLGITQLLKIGIPLSNTYIYASKQEKQTRNWHKVYIQSGVIFLLVGVMFVLIYLNTYHMTFSNVVIYVWTGLLLVVTIASEFWVRRP